MAANGSEILTEAMHLVNNDRNADYGPPLEDYTKVRDLFRAMTGIDMTVEQAILFPLAMKLSRLRKSMENGGLHRDSIVDSCGYLACLQMAHDDASESLQ